MENGNGKGNEIGNGLEPDDGNYTEGNRIFGRRKEINLG